jgi:hypothetical protein
MGRRKKQYLPWDEYVPQTADIETDATIDAICRRYTDIRDFDNYHSSELFEQIQSHCIRLVNGFGCTWSPEWNDLLRAVLVYYRQAATFFDDFFVDVARENAFLPSLNKSERELLDYQERKETEQGNRASIVDRFLESKA